MPVTSTIPKQHRKHYDNLVRTQGRAAANAWLRRVSDKSKGRRQRQPSLGPASHHVQLSGCAAKYLAALVDASSQAGQGACVPLPPTMPSHRFTAMARVSLAVGSGGMAFVTFAPKNAVIGNQTANPAGRPLYHSSSAGTYAGTTISTNTTTTGVIATNSNSALTASQFDTGDSGNSLFYRLVGATLKLRYAGTVLENGGLITGQYAANSGSLSGVSFATMASRPECEVDRVELDAEYSVSWRPGEGDFDYSADTMPNDTLDTTTEDFLLPGFCGHCLGFIVEGTAGDVYFAEAYASFEVIGDGIPTPQRSHGDAVGANAAIAAINSAGVAQTTKPTSERITDGLKIVGEVVASGTALVKAVKGAASVASDVFAEGGAIEALGELAAVAIL
jgi:hypothetical protein